MTMGVSVDNGPRGVLATARFTGPALLVGIAHSSTVRRRRPRLVALSAEPCDLAVRSVAGPALSAEPCDLVVLSVAGPALSAEPCDLVVLSVAGPALSAESRSPRANPSELNG